MDECKPLGSTPSPPTDSTLLPSTHSTPSPSTHSLNAPRPSSAAVHARDALDTYALLRWTPAHPLMECPLTPPVPLPSSPAAAAAAQMLRDAMLDTARRLLDARRVVKYQSEVGVLATLMYHGLTTGSGQVLIPYEYTTYFTFSSASSLTLRC